jgi:wyosine [tRNA(Phe)-imidazoG37] synthetase (radical SAM superfamily)
MIERLVFGPVTSSRLGRSLGLDLLGRKICSFDCLYCEVGPTRVLTRERRPYVTAKELLAELGAWKEANRDLGLDHVTLGGSGEPTLNSELPEILQGAKRLFPSIPVAVLTNASLLDDPRVRDELGKADVVLPSLDSLVESEFKVVNRPRQGIELQRIVEGLKEFRSAYAGRIYLEVLLVAGINDTDANLQALEAFCQGFGADRVDVTTLSRPGAYPSALPVDKNILNRFREILGPGAKSMAPVAISDGIGHNYQARVGTNTEGKTLVGVEREETTQRVLASLLRRPQTELQLAEALGLDAEATAAALTALLAAGEVRRDERDFYLATGGARRKAG